MSKRAGRPKEEFEPWKNWQNDILKEYREGASDVEIRALIVEKKKRAYLSHDLWARWLEEEVQFSETVKMGRLLSEAWWTKKGRKGLETDSMQDTKKLNYTGWYMNMKNRFGWADKQEVTERKVNLTESMSNEQLEAEISKLENN